VQPEDLPTVSVDQLPEQIPADAVWLDVREDEEWAAGHIDGALHVPMGRVPHQLQLDPGRLTPDTPVVVLCKVGGRSAQVTAWLVRQGYAATNLAGGMLAWEAAGRPMTAEHAGPAAVI
jgi:rhodanese-related sulfurtransferase